MSVFQIRKGYDIPIPGRAEEKILDLPAPSQVAIRPVNLRGFNPRLRVQVGDLVKIGTPLAEDKNQPRRLLGSPAGGQVAAITRGARRRIEEIVIQVQTGGEEAVSFPADGGEGIAREAIVARLLESGLWCLVKQRPFAKMASPDSVPQCIYVNAMDTAPLAANPILQLQGKDSFLETGLKILSKLTTGKVYLCRGATVAPSIPSLQNSSYAEIHQFIGPHPAGCVGTHVHHLEPIKKDHVGWTLSAVETAAIGQFFLQGKVPVDRLVAVAGESAPHRNYVRTRVGAPISSILGSSEGWTGKRIISGNVLTGEKVEPTSYLGYYDTTLTVIPEGGKRRFLGWLMPGLDRSSFSRAYASSLVKRDRYSFDTSLNGDQRALVPIGSYEAVMALDIEPVFLFKSIMYGDLVEAEQLGLLECAEEDVALCSYICHSKIDYCSLIRQGLDQYEKEG